MLELLRVSEVTELVAEIRERVVDLRLRAVVTPDEHTIGLDLGPEAVTISCHPEVSRIHLGLDDDGDLARIGFGRTLATALRRARVVDVLQPAPDRVVRLVLSGAGGARLALVAELAGRHGNLFLLDAQDRILGSLAPNHSERRDLVPGAPYVLPVGRLAPEALGPSRLAGHPEGPSAAARAWLGPRVLALRTAALRRALDGPLRSRAAAQRRLLGRLEADQARHAATLQGQRLGDLLLAQLRAVPPRADAVTLIDLFDPAAPAITLPLDPRRSAVENAQAYHRQAARGRRGLAAVAPRLAEVRATLERTERARAALATLDLAGLRAEWAAVAPRAGGAPAVPLRRTPAAPRTAWLAYVARTGEAILVGRSAEDNDRLTFRHARGRDVWLHARDVPGAHVILRLDRGGDPPPEALLDAAALAHHHSDARRAEAGDVEWTQVKHLRRGRRPGEVYVSRGQTIHVRRDETRLSRLLHDRSTATRLTETLAGADED